MNFDAFIKNFLDSLCITLVANLCLAKLKTWDVTGSCQTNKETTQQPLQEDKDESPAKAWARRRLPWAGRPPGGTSPGLPPLAG